MKKIFAGVIITCITLFNSAFAIAPTFDRDFRNQLITDPSGKNETVFNPTSLRISSNSTLRDNVFNVFSPTNNNSVLWSMIRIIMIGILVLYFAWTGIDFMMHPNDEAKNKQARRSFMYLLFGAFLVYGVTWILGRGLAITDLTGDTPNASNNFVNNLIGRVIFQILAFLKAFAFFYAIIITIWYGFNMIRALDKEDTLKNAKRGIINVILALVFIKVIDFVFFIAQDVSFVSKAKSFMLTIARAIGYILGAVMVLSLIYTGFKYVSASGDEAKVKDAKNTLSTIFYVVLIIFLFLLVAWQVIAEFA